MNKVFVTIFGISIVGVVAAKVKISYLDHKKEQEETERELRLNLRAVDWAGDRVLRKINNGHYTTTTDVIEDFEFHHIMYRTFNS